MNKDREECSVSELTWSMQTSADVHLRCTCTWLIGAMFRSVGSRTRQKKNVQECVIVRETEGGRII